MRLTGVDPHKLMVWAQEAYAASVPGETVDLHVWATGWGLRVEAAAVEDFVMEPDGSTRS